MPQMIDEAGNIWEVDAAGNPIGLVSQGGQRGTVIADPNAGLDTTYRQGQIEAQRRAAEDDYRKRQEAVAKEEEARIQRLRAQAIQSLGHDEVLAAIANARREIGQGWSTGLSGQILSNVGGTAARDLSGSINTIASALTLDKLKSLKESSPTGASGLGSLTEKEGMLLRDSVASIDQAQSEEKLLDSLAKIETHYRRYRALVNGENPDIPEVGRKYGVVPAKSGGSSAPGNTGKLTSEGKMADDPALAGTNARVAELIRSGATEQEVRDYLNTVQPTLGDRAINIKEAIEYNNQHPGGEIKVDTERYWQPNSPLSQVAGDVAMSPFGTGVVNVADALTAGTLDNLTSNPALTRAVMGGLEERNPNAATIGQFAGNIAGTAGVGMGLARASGRLAAPILADALYGGAYGAGSADEGNRYVGALSGAALNAIGGKIGERAMAGVGSAVRGVTDPATRYLASRGIRMTPGQMFGGRIKGMEDRTAGFAGLGDRIIDRQRQSIGDFNRAAFEEGYSPIGYTPTAVGVAGEEAASNAVQNYYNGLLDPVSVYADQPFMSALSQAQQAGSRIPGELAGEVQNTLSTRVGPFIDPDTGQITGRNFQAIQQGLRRDMSALSGKTRYDLYREQAGNIQDALRGVVERQAPGVVGGLDNANAAYRNQGILADALIAARNDAEELFTPAQLGNAVISNTKKYGGKSSAVSTDRPFYELQRAAQRVLPNKVPNSGTASRMREGSLVGKAQGILADAIKAPLYSETLGDILPTLALQRPEVMRDLGEILVNQRRLGGMFGGAALLPYAGQ